MEKRTEVTIETHELTIVRSGRFRTLPVSTQRGWCSACGQEVDLLTAEAAAEHCGISRREIYRRLERGELHFQETADSVVQVCLNSLRA